MYNYIQYIREFHDGNKIEIEFIKNHLAKHLESNQENQDEIEHILDYLYSNKTVNIDSIGYSTIKEKADKWIKKLNSVSTKDNEVEGVDYETYLDFKDGFKIIKLLSKSCYEREGKLMSHCVGSYYGRDTTIYSLRDSNNKPHCTIEDGNQIKGKGNGSIDPKYVDYIVKFLEKIGMTVGENEMKNIGYYKLESIDEGLTSDSLYNGYIYEGKLDTIHDKNGEVYKGMGLWNIRPVCEIEDNGKFRLYEDIKAVVEYEKIISKNGHYTQNASSGDYTQNASSGDYTKNASSGDYTKNASSGHYTKNASSGHYTKNASSGHYTKSEINGKYGITADIGKDSKSKGIIGTWIVLAEYEKNAEGYWYPKYVKCGQIDGDILKENVWYTLKNGEFTEVSE